MTSIRAATPTDVSAIQRIYAAVVAETFASFEETPPDADEVARRMQAEPLLPWLVADDAGRIAGYAYASHHRQRRAYRWSVDCSIYLAVGYRSRGIGRTLYGQLVDEVAELGYRVAFAGIALPNAASVRLHEALGFTPVGVFRDVGYKHGAWRDVGWWQRTLRLPAMPPPEPVRWTST